MKLDYCASHSGAGSPDLPCLAIRHDDGTLASPAEVWADVERLRELLRECRLALIWSNAADDAFIARLGAAIGDDE